MNKRYSSYGQRPALLAFAALVCTALTGCETTQESRRADLEQDRDTCADFGTQYGTPEHTECMLVQQRRRDSATLDALEKQRVSAETAKTNVEMLERRRCEKEAKKDREAGRRPRSCR
ncbi:MAG TPA: hypothetical protein VGD45_26430 [Steroidobacter sp.]|uniref:hypothetical protein n=1 Tax=Steroidobacter sp. TaxID=1978227 RepID=UPI002EDAE421